MSILLTCNSCAALFFYAIANSIQIPFIIQSDLIQSYNTSTIFCKIRAFLITYATIVKGYAYLVQAISRFFITVLYKRRFLLTFRFNWIMIITSWIVNGMFISPLTYQYEPESHLCNLTTQNFLTSFLAIAIVFFVTTNTVIILYEIIFLAYYATQFINILVIGGTPYLLCVIFNVISTLPCPLYSISILFIACAAAVESIALLFTNAPLRKIFFNKQGWFQTNEPAIVMRTQLNRTNQIAPCPRVSI
jgi:hypothetical protein